MWGRKDSDRARVAVRAAGALVMENALTNALGVEWVRRDDADREADRLFAEVDRMGGMGPRPEPAPGPAGTIRGAEQDREAGQ